LKDGQTIIHREEGEVLFTEYGLSGICVMQCSRFMNKEGLYFELDLLSAIFRNQHEAIDEIKARRARFSSQSPVMLLEGIFLPKLSYAVLKQAGIPLRGEKAGSLSDADLEKIVRTAYHYRVEAIKTRTLEDAQVTAGGVSCSEFNPKTMESRAIDGLFAAGEILNVDGDCGGYNLMFAFSSGMIAGGFRKEELN
jgi:predicted Rossmann fold flavoprotein